MNIGVLLNQFAHDDKVGIVLLLIAADVVLGVAVAVKAGTFRLSYISDFLRNDVLGKVFPWFVVYAADKASHSADLPVLPIDFGAVAAAAFVAVTAALAGSILNSLRDFGVALPVAIAGDDPNAKIADDVVVVDRVADRP